MQGVAGDALGLSKVAGVVGRGATKVGTNLAFKSAIMGGAPLKIANGIINTGKLLSKTPAISALAGKGMVSKVANKAILGVNKVSALGALKFLNPFDNPTTMIMGATSAQQKIRSVIENGI